MNAIGLKLLTPPSIEPVTLADLKARLRVTIDDEDGDLTALLTECRLAAEREIRRVFISQSWLMVLDHFPYGYGEIRVPLPPLQSVESITYFDTNGVQQTLDPARYHVGTVAEPGRIWPLWNTFWPYVQYGRPEAVEIRFTAGYGDTADAVPATLINAIKLIAADRRENPTGPVAISPAARRLLDAEDYGEA